MQTAEPTPKKPRRRAKRRKIIVPQDQKLKEMFTTNIDRIQMYIDTSPFPDKMDAKVIWEINEQAAGNLRFPCDPSLKYVTNMQRTFPRSYPRYFTS